VTTIRGWVRILVRGTWWIVLTAVLGNVALQRVGVDAAVSARAGVLVSIGSPPLEEFGDGARLEERSEEGKLLDDGVGGLTLELVAPRTFSLIQSSRTTRRVRHLGGVYVDAERFFGTQVPSGVLEFQDSGGASRAVAVDFGYPGHDSETGTLIFYLRPASRGVPAGSSVRDGWDVLDAGVIREVVVTIGGD
jgi:hypothetical protein